MTFKGAGRNFPLLVSEGVRDHMCIRVMCSYKLMIPHRLDTAMCTGHPLAARWGQFSNKDSQETEGEPWETEGVPRWGETAHVVPESLLAHLPPVPSWRLGPVEIEPEGTESPGQWQPGRGLPVQSTAGGSSNSDLTPGIVPVDHLPDYIPKPKGTQQPLLRWREVLSEAAVKNHLQLCFTKIGLLCHRRELPVPVITLTEPKHERKKRANLVPLHYGGLREEDWAPLPLHFPLLLPQQRLLQCSPILFPEAAVASPTSAPAGNKLYSALTQQHRSQKSILSSFTSAAAVLASVETSPLPQGHYSLSYVRSLRSLHLYLALPSSVAPPEPFLYSTLLQ
ncbi:hypothetical protein E1301_Tti005446 [Triplophysa tibetana]|uniref:Uncharacterized protein n=1 Tax=Triplophysa tibetana TaxID=1572043 RepID=A0A5A9PRD2_9TELE|nr:hypothetical protein E1301_Tti005446 [Triplophysa tibetana]